MNKNFKKIIKPIVVTVFLSGISFGLCANTDEVVPTSHETIYVEQTVTVPSLDYSEPLIAADGSIQLASNLTTEDKLTAAFSDFSRTQKDIPAGCRKLFQRFVNEFGEIDIEGAAIDGDMDEEYLNLALSMPDNVLVSINAFADDVDGDSVGLNLFLGKELVLSDITSFEAVRQYLAEIQA